MAITYEQDIAAWGNEQANMLRAGEFDRLGYSAYCRGDIMVATPCVTVIKLIKKVKKQSVNRVGRAVRAKGIAKFSSIGKGAHGTPYSDENFVQLL